MTARDNVLVGLFYGEQGTRARPSRPRSRRLLEFLGLSPHADRPVSSLNLMERKIVELARALATRPKLCCWTS